MFSSDEGNVGIVEMLFSTSLVALILSPRHLIIQNTKVRRTIIPYPTAAELYGGSPPSLGPDVDSLANLPLPL